MYKIIKQSFKINFKYNIFFTKNIFDINNTLLIKILNKENKTKKNIIIFIDKNVSKSHLNLETDIKNYINKHKKYINLKSKPINITGGEKIKNHYMLVKYIYKLIDTYKICRQSFIISIGGGTIQDLLGYIASTAHRGIKLIRMPTTVLSQDDSGVGVKNGINFLNKKNFIGCFSPPFAVINDYTFLNSLKNKELIEGISEAIKVALIKDETLFEFIEKNTQKIIDRHSTIIEKIIYECAKLHAEHISKKGDPFETLSSRPLDFGHWSAHKIESLSKYKISHGESVGIGIILDCTYSYLIKLLDKNSWKRIINTFIKLNLPIYTKELSIKKNGKQILFDGLEEFREHLGGKLTITLIKNIGTQLDIHHINITIYQKALKLIKKINEKYNNVAKK